MIVQYCGAPQSVLIELSKPNLRGWKKKKEGIIKIPLQFCNRCICYMNTIELVRRARKFDVELGKKDMKQLA